MGVKNIIGELQVNGSPVVTEEITEQLIEDALAQAKASGEFKGADGKTPYIENGYWYIDGANTGVKAQGNDGKGISSVAKTSTNGLVDTYTITFTDGTKTTYTVTNGKDGYTPEKGTDYWTSADKNAIVNEVDTLFTAEVEAEVEDQLDGAKAGIVAEILAQIGGMPVFGTVDENNVITTTTRLFNGTYVLRYKDENNTYSELAEFTIAGGAEDVITYNVTNNLVACKTSNEAETANSNTGYQATITPDASSGYVGRTAIRVKMGGVDISSTAVSGDNIDIANVTGDIEISCIGYKTNKRLSLSGGGESAQDGTEVTGFIPAPNGKDTVLYIKNIAYSGDTARGVVGYDDNFAKTPTTTNGINLNALFDMYGSDAGNGVRKSARLGSMANFTDGDNIKYIRLCSTDINANSIITVDEPIV